MFKYSIKIKAILSLSTFGLGTILFSQEANTGQVRIIEGMELFMGEWVIPSDALKDFPKEQQKVLANRSMISFEWAKEKMTMRMFENHSRENTNDAVLEVLAAVNPVTRKINFLGSNNLEGFYFEGEFIFDGPKKLFRIYDVYYPANYDWAKQGISSMKFRDTYVLREDGRIEQTVDFYSSKAKKWVSFNKGKTYILERLKNE